ncbi:MAG: phosphoadenylyl-sulfate reductase [Rhabdaerophilum sp.]
MTHPLTSPLADLNPVERIRRLRSEISGEIVFTTSFGLEDQVLTHLIVESGAAITFATLDTGRLFPEAYTLWQHTEERYGLKIFGYTPRHDAVEDYIAEQGINGFYSSIEARKACCNIRKVEPLSRALRGAAGWISGLRADQSANRAGVALIEHDQNFGLLKLNPLIDWSRKQAVDFAHKHAVPVNPLHEWGFLSIGCAPCTRAIQPGEPERAGRWWWEEETKKECGLHIGPDGRIVREGTRP